MDGKAGRGGVAEEVRVDPTSEGFARSFDDFVVDRHLCER